MKVKVVIDTNALVSSLSSKSKHHFLIEMIYSAKIDVYVTSEILLEYEEVLSTKYSRLTAYDFLMSLLEFKNVKFIDVYFKWRLLSDSDDNKFTDCFVASNSDYLVTNDTDFNILKTIGFPNITTIKLDEFLQLMKSNS